MILKIFDGVTEVPIPYFGVQGYNMQNQYELVRGTFSPGLLESGDGEVVPTSIVLQGPIQGEDLTRYEQEKDRLVRLFNAPSKKLRKGDLELLVGSVLATAETLEDKRKHNITTNAFTLSMLLPYWSTIQETVITAPIGLIVSSVNLKQKGNRTTYPKIKVTGVDMTGVDLSLGGRSFAWRGFLNAGEELLIDCLTGNVLSGTSNEIIGVQDGSQFLQLAGDNQEHSLQVVALGAIGTLEVSFHDAYRVG